jgi:hypothetical protein
MHEKQRFSTNAHPPYVTLIWGRRKSMMLKHRHPITSDNTTENSIPPYRKPRKTFPYPPSYMHEKQRFSMNAHPPYVTFSLGRRQSMLLKHQHPMMPNNLTGKSNPSYGKPQNTVLNRQPKCNETHDFQRTITQRLSR